MSLHLWDMWVCVSALAFIYQMMSGLLFEYTTTKWIYFSLVLFLYMRRLARYRRGTVIHVLFSTDFSFESKTIGPRHGNFGEPLVLSKIGVVVSQSDTEVRSRKKQPFHMTEYGVSGEAMFSGDSSRTEHVRVTLKVLIHAVHVRTFYENRHICTPLVDSAFYNWF